MRLQDLAEMDIRELVSEVHEFFGDFSALDPFHFCIPLPKPHVALQPFNFQFAERSGQLVVSAPVHACTADSTDSHHDQCMVC